MATIKFKRGSGQPTGLTAYEPAWDTTNNRLFVNNGTTAMWVGALVVQDTTLAGNCAYYIPTQNSVKTYVDNSVSAGAVSSVNGATGAVTIGGGTAIAVATSTAARGITITNTGVWSINGVTGTISNIAVTNAAQSFTGLQQFVNGISSAGGTFYGAQTFVNGATFSAITNFTAGLCASGACFSGNAIFVGGSSVRFIETGGGTQYVGLVGPTAITTEFNLTLPNSAGSAGQALVTDGAGLLSWSSAVVAASVGVTSDAGNLNTRYLVFTDTAGSAKTMYIDDGKTPLTYIPDSGLMSVGGNLLVAGNQIGNSGAVVYPFTMSGGASGNVYLGNAGTTSSTLVGVCGSLVITTGSISSLKSSGDIFTTTATSINAFNSATSLILGNTGTNASNTELMQSTGNTSGNTFSIASGLAGGGKINVVVGNSTSSGNTLAVYGAVTATGNVDVGGAITTTKASNSIFTTGATLINAFNSASTLTVGNTGTAATTTNLILLTGNTSANTLNIGTGIAAGGKLDVQLGNATAAVGSINLYGNINGTGNLSITGTYSGNVVRTVNGFTAGVTLAGGTGISVSNSSGTITITSVDVASVAGLTGNVGITGTANQINTTISGQTLTIALPSAVTMPGSLTVTGDLTVNGTTTTVNSTTVTVQDPIIAIGGVTSNAAPPAGDVKDRGILAQYRTSGDVGQTGFFGIDRSADVFSFYTAATVASEVISGTVGSAQFSGLNIIDNGTSYRAILKNGIATAADRTFTFPDHTGTVVAPASLGTAGFVLYSNGAAAQPTWSNPTSLAAGTLVTAEGSGTYYLAMATGVAATGTAFYVDTTATALTYATSTGTLTCSFVEATVDGGSYP